MRFPTFVISALVLLSPAVQAAETGTVKGDGYHIERVSPTHKKIKVLSPQGATVRISQRGRREMAKELAKGAIPFEYAPTDSGGEYFLEVTLANGESWWKGSLKVQDRTEYQVYVDGPKEPERFTEHHRHDRHDMMQPPGPTTMVPPPPIVPPAPVAAGMNTEDFESLKGAIKGESFSKAKLDVVKTAAKGQMFTIGQVGDLVDLFDFGRDRVAVVEMLDKRIVDRQNAFKLYSHFTFDSEKKEVKKILDK